MSATIEALESIAAAFNAHDIEKIMSFFARDCCLEMPRGPHPFGRRYDGYDAVRSGLLGRLEGIPDVHYGDATHFASGDWGASRWTLTGTTVAGQRVEVCGCDFYRFRNGKVVLKDSYWKIVEKG
jgi:ketosteroid isomerase-like protein